MNPIAYSYIRFSTPEQAAGDSYRRQTTDAAAFCAEHGLTLADGKEYTFFDRGLSAYKGHHIDDAGQLRRFLDFVEEGKIAAGSWLLVESMDRLSREKVSVALPRFLDLLNKGITVATLIDKRIYTSGANELDLIISIVQMARAHSESEHKAYRLSKVWTEKKNKARSELQPVTPKVPAWIKLNEKNKFELIPEKVAVVERIFQMAIDGYGSKSIARIFNSEGVPIISTRKRKGQLIWGASSIAKILALKVVLGEYQPGKRENGKQVEDGPPIKNYYPAAISEDTYYAAQAAISGRLVAKTTKQSKRFNIWQGLARCGSCGGAMHMVNKGKPPKGATYLRCFNAARLGDCNARTVRYDRSEIAFKEILSKVDSLSLVQDSSKAIQKALDVVMGKLTNINDRLTAAEAAYTEFPSSAGARLLQTLETDQKNVQAAAEGLQQQLANSRITDKADFFNRLDLLTYEGRNAANRLLKRLGLVVFVRQRQNGETYYLVWDADCIADFMDIENSGYTPRFGIVQYKNGNCHLDSSRDSETLYRAVKQGDLTPDQAFYMFNEFADVLPGEENVFLADDGESGDAEDTPTSYVRLNKK